MITKLKIFKENILVPRNIEGRKEKANQAKEKARQQFIQTVAKEEIYEGDFILADYMLDVPEHEVKIRKITGWLLGFNILGDGYDVIETLPKWLKNIEVGKSLEIIHNKLHSVENLPYKIGGGINISYSIGLKSLKGIPEIVNGNFDCGGCDLTTLVGGPKIVRGDFDCDGNPLENFDGCPEIVEGDFSYISPNHIIDTPPKNCKIGGDFIT